MATITEDLSLPGDAPLRASIEVTLVGVGSDPVTGFAAARTILGRLTPPVADDGVWSFDLDANADIEPANTVYRRIVRVDGQVWDDRTFVVPVGAGTHQLRDVVVDPLTALPAVEPSNERDYAELTADSAPIAINALAIAPVPGLVVSVPDVPRPCRIDASIGVAHSVANANVAVAIGRVGLGTGDLTQAKGAGWGQLGAAGAVSTIPARARIGPRSPGDYQLYLNGTGGNATVKAALFAPTSLAVLEV